MFTTTNHKVLAIATRTQRPAPSALASVLRAVVRSLATHPAWTAPAVVIGMIAFVTMLTVFAPVAPMALADTSTPAPVAQCEEDQPCWDCATMGNHICGTPATVETVPALDDERAVCSTDAECAQWDAQGYTMPDTDDATGDDVTYVCPEGLHVYDTENPDMGRSGVVCAPVAAFLPYVEV